MRRLPQRNPASALDVLAFIGDATRAGERPSIRAICERFNFASNNSASVRIEELRELGLLRPVRGATSNRVLALTELGWKKLGVPLCGHCRQPLPKAARE